MKKISTLFTAIVLTLTFLLTGCGTEPAAQNSASASDSEKTATSYPLTVKNYTKAEGAAEWQEKTIIFEQAPERIVATTRTAAEFLIHLGLADKIVGVGGVFGKPDESVSQEFNKLKNLGKSYITKEVAMSVNPDFIFGRGGLFDNADWGVGTVDALNQMGINTYVMESSVPGGTFDSIYKDIETIGKIFGVQEKAQEFAAELKGRQEKVQNALKVIKQDKTFAYIHSSEPESLSVYAAYNDTFFSDMFKMLKLKNVFEKEQGEISVEALIEQNPNILVTLHWDTEGEAATQKDENATIKNIMTNAKLESLDAVKNKQVFVANYNHLFGYSYQTLDGVEKLAKELYPELFK